MPKDDNVIDMLASSCRIRASSVTLWRQCIGRDAVSKDAQAEPDISLLNSHELHS
jgi:hypothetical protein